MKKTDKIIISLLVILTLISVGLVLSIINVNNIALKVSVGETILLAEGEGEGDTDPGETGDPGEIPDPTPTEVPTDGPVSGDDEGEGMDEPYNPVPITPYDPNENKDSDEDEEDDKPYVNKGEPNVDAEDFLDNRVVENKVENEPENNTVATMKTVENDNGGSEILKKIKKGLIGFGIFVLLVIVISVGVVIYRDRTGYYDRKDREKNNDDDEEEDNDDDDDSRIYNEDEDNTGETVVLDVGKLKEELDKNHYDETEKDEEDKDNDNEDEEDYRSRRNKKKKNDTPSVKITGDEIEISFDKKDVD